MLLLVNGDAPAVEFTLPAGAWQALLDTGEARGRSDRHVRGPAPLTVGGRSIVVFALEGHGLTLPEN